MLIISKKLPNKRSCNPAWGYSGSKKYYRHKKVTFCAIIFFHLGFLQNDAFLFCSLSYYFSLGVLFTWLQPCVSEVIKWLPLYSVGVRGRSELWGYLSLSATR